MAEVKYFLEETTLKRRRTSIVVGKEKVHRYPLTKLLCMSEKRRKELAARLQRRPPHARRAFVITQDDASIFLKWSQPGKTSQEITRSTMPAISTPFFPQQ